MTPVQVGDVVKIDTHRFVVTDVGFPTTYEEDLGNFGGQRIQPNRGMSITVAGKPFKVNELYRSLSTTDVTMASRNGKVVYRAKVIG